MQSRNGLSLAFWGEPRNPGTMQVKIWSSWTHLERRIGSRSLEEESWLAGLGPSFA